MQNLKKLTKKAKNKAPSVIAPSSQRSAIMRAVKGKDTAPEITLRNLLKSKRFKFEIYADLPGKPDIVLPKRKVAIRVMGCFWHNHSCKRGRRKPKTNVEYWVKKIQNNRRRDRQNKVALEALKWSVIDVWECQIKQEKFEARFSNKITKLSILL